MLPWLHDTTTGDERWSAPTNSRRRPFYGCLACGRAEGLVNGLELARSSGASEAAVVRIHSIGTPVKSAFV